MLHCVPECIDQHEKTDVGGSHSAGTPVIFVTQVWLRAKLNLPFTAQKQMSQLVKTLGLLGLATLLPSSAVHGECMEPRVRMSWDTMVAQGKADTYIRAVNMAVEQGYQELFSQVHREQGENVNQAHGTSGECNKTDIHGENRSNRRTNSVYLVASPLFARV